MIFKKADQELNNEADEIIKALLGNSSSSSSGPVTQEVDPGQKNDSFSTEKYQMPVRVGQSGKSLEEGDKPWIVGHFAPGVWLNATHAQGHSGTDVRAPSGAPIFPIASGVVVAVGVGAKSGNYVKVAHEDGKVISFYGHMLRTSTQNGQNVTQQSVLGEVGSTGNAKGRHAVVNISGKQVNFGHVHLEVKVNGTLVNPLGVIGKPVGTLAKKAKLLSDIEKFAEEFVQISQT